MRKKGEEMRSGNKERRQEESGRGYKTKKEGEPGGTRRGKEKRGEDQMTGCVLLWSPAAL